VGYYGSRNKKLLAKNLLVIYTIFGGLFKLISLCIIYYCIGTFDYTIFYISKFNINIELIIFIGFIITFFIKTPVFGLHNWLPLAHVEAPLAGSILLAAVLIKLGSYGFIRFALPLLPNACSYFSPLVNTLALLAIIYASLTTIRQTDLKRIIAYSSIGHMGVVMLGIFSLTIEGIEGSIFLQIGHGIVSSGLFIIVTTLYERHHTRLVKYYRGLVITMPIFSIMFLLFTMANIGLPGSGSFVGEFLILTGSYQTNTIITFIGATGMILGGCYSLWLFNRIAYGNLKTQYISLFIDINKREFYSFLPLILGTLITLLTIYQ